MESAAASGVRATPSGAADAPDVAGIDVSRQDDFDARPLGLAELNGNGLGSLVVGWMVEMTSSTGWVRKA